MYNFDNLTSRKDKARKQYGGTTEKYNPFYLCVEKDGILSLVPEKRIGGYTYFGILCSVIDFFSGR